MQKINNTLLTEILSVLGAVFLFLYGMKQMSDSLQKLSGFGIKNIFNKFTDKKSKGFFSGLALTSLLQTSSASTLLVVSFVNAGIISFINSIPVIIGANVGTTIKIWFISTLGFQFDLGKYSLILLIIGFPFLFIRRGRLKNFGEFIIGFSLMFLGLFFMKNIFSQDLINEYFINLAQSITGQGYKAIILFVLLGFVITSVIQSSSATITLTFVLCYSGIISFPMAVAMVMGENIGTTITANIGALIANTNAKRAAFSHFLMNLITISFLLFIFFPFIKTSDFVLINFFSINTSLNIEIPLALAFVHSSINIILAIIMLPLSNLIAKICTLIIPDKLNIVNDKLIIENGFFSSSEFQVWHLNKELIRLAKIAKSTFNLIPQLLIEKNEKEFHKMFTEITNFEKNNDLIIKKFYDSISEFTKSEISSDCSKLILKMRDNVFILNNIGKINYKFAMEIYSKNENKAWINQEMRNDIIEIFNLINESLDSMLLNISLENNVIDLSNAKLNLQKINYLKEQLELKLKNKNYTQEVSENAINHYKSLLNLCNEISSEIYNVSYTNLNY